MDESAWAALVTGRGPVNIDHPLEFGQLCEDKQVKPELLKPISEYFHALQNEIIRVTSLDHE